MSEQRIAELRALRVLLKSGDYDGTHIMAAWIALEEYANLLERRHDEPSAEPVAYRRLIDDPYVLHPRYVYADATEIKPLAKNGWTPLYTRPASPPLEQRTGSLSNTPHRPCNQSLGSPAVEAVADEAAGRSVETDAAQCEGRYPVPQTSPPREEGTEITYRCALRTGHGGPCGART